MRKFLGALSALALLASAGTATAQQQQEQQPAAQQQGGQQQQMEAEGTVGTIDQTSLVLTMEDGTEYVLAEGNLIQGLQPGMEVKVTYQEQDGKKMVTDIQPAEQ